MVVRALCARARSMKSTLDLTTRARSSLGLLLGYRERLSPRQHGLVPRAWESCSARASTAQSDEQNRVAQSTARLSAGLEDNMGQTRASDPRWAILQPPRVAEGRFYCVRNTWAFHGIAGVDPLYRHFRSGGGVEETSSGPSPPFFTARGVSFSFKHAVVALPPPARVPHRLWNRALERRAFLHVLLFVSVVVELAARLRAAVPKASLTVKLKALGHTLVVRESH